MKKIELGKTGIDVSIICLGTMFFGTKVSKEVSYNIMDDYCEKGGSFMDTANIYTYGINGSKGGESEKLIGEWFRSRKNREKIFIATKVGVACPVDNMDNGLSPEQIEYACDQSLKRMGINEIDLYYAHIDDRSTDLENTLAAFKNLVKKGKVKYFGASNFTAWRLQKANLISEIKGYPSYVCMQTRYTYLVPRSNASFSPQLSANKDLIDYCNNDNIRLLAYSPLLSGAYTRKKVPLPEQHLGSDNEARLAVLKDIANKNNATINQVVLAWMINQKYPVIPVTGVSTVEQLKENLGALEINFLKDQLNRLNDAHYGLPESNK